MWVGGVAVSQTRSKPLKTPPNHPENRLFRPEFHLLFSQISQKPLVGWVGKQIWERSPKQNRFFLLAAPITGFPCKSFLHFSRLDVVGGKETLTLMYCLTFLFTGSIYSFQQIYFPETKLDGYQTYLGRTLTMSFHTKISFSEKKTIDENVFGIYNTNITRIAMSLLIVRSL